MNTFATTIIQILLLVVGLILVVFGAVSLHWGPTILGIIFVFAALSELIFSGGYEI